MLVWPLVSQLSRHCSEQGPTPHPFTTSTTRCSRRCFWHIPHKSRFYTSNQPHPKCHPNVTLYPNSLPGLLTAQHNGVFSTSLQGLQDPGTRAQSH